mgnify:CR=1 FL=1
MKNKKAKAIIAFSVGTAILAGTCLVLRSVLRNQNAVPEMYSIEWLRSLTDEALKNEREVVRQMYCKREFNYKRASI